MSATPTLTRRLINVIVPTRGQGLSSLLVALAVIAPTQSRAIFDHIDLPTATLTAGQTQLGQRFDTILNSPIVSQTALISFWAIVGLLTYLICWGAYNLLIEARNEVTLNTAYTNRGHWHSPHGTLALKAVAAVGLACVLVGFRYGAALWLALAARFATTPSLATAGWLTLAVIGLAVQLYLILVFIQLTFTPWYRAAEAGQPFTDA